MGVIVDVVLPFFAVILAGYLALRTGLLGLPSIKGLNLFVFWCALPALLVDKVGGTALLQILNWRIITAYYGANVALYVLTFAWGRLAGDGSGASAVRSLGVVWGNYGYLGLPLLIQAYGPSAALPVVLAITIDNLLPVPVTVAAIEAEPGRGGGQGIGRVLRNVLRNPLVAAVLVGMAIAAVGRGLPTPVSGFLRLLGAAAAPCALFALGASLVGVRLSGGGRDLLLATFGKMVASPVLVFLLGAFVVPLGRVELAATVLTAAMPTAASVFVIAQRYETWAPQTSSLILLTHLVSVVSLPLLLILFG